MLDFKGKLILKGSLKSKANILFLIRTASYFETITCFSDS